MSKAKNFDENYELKLEFPEVWREEIQTTTMGGVGICFGETYF